MYCTSIMYLRKFFAFEEYQKHSRIFHCKTLFDITIKHILNFVKECQIYCFHQILPYGNNTIKCQVLTFLQEYMLCRQFSQLVKIPRQQNCKKLYSISKMQYFKILFVFPEHQKHQRHFHSKITLADITIKYILSFAEQYQRCCFSLKLTFGNNTTQYDVLYVFKKYFDINSSSYQCKKLKATEL